MPLENGIASLSTVSRLLSGIDEELFLYVFIEWMSQILERRGRHIAIDGKALRAAASKVRDTGTPMVMNAIDVATGLVLAQLSINGKGNEITALPELLELLDIRENTITIDAIGTQTDIMEQILDSGGHFVLVIKRNQPSSYDEIMEFFREISTDYKNREVSGYAIKHPEVLELYEEYNGFEKNRDRHEYRSYKVCQYTEFLTKTREDWGFIKCVGHIERVRILMERDAEGNDVTPDKAAFLKNGSRRQKKTVTGDSAESDIQSIGAISDREMNAEEMGNTIRNHWAIENRLHHVLDDTFREDRSPAKKSKNPLALLRKIVYNILRIAMIKDEVSDIMTEAMDEFADDLAQIERYVFGGIERLTVK